MKRSLVLGCAALALCAGSSAALAQTKFDVTIGGDAYFQGAYVDQKQDAGLRSTELRNRFRVVLTPTAKADNGLEYGARLRLRAVNGPGAVNRSLDNDRAYIFAKGAFGTVQAGTINGLSDEYGLIGPNVEGIAGSADNSTLDFLTGSPIYDAGIAGRATNFRNLVSGNAATRLIYLTPTFAGFQGGISYAPRSDDANNSVNRRKYSTVAVGGFGAYAPSFQDVGEVGGIYSREIGPVTFEASGFYEFGTATKETTGTAFNNFKDLSSYNIGANIGFAGAKIGAMYRNAGKSGYCKAGCGGHDQDTWIVGANYTLGPVILAANYQRYEDAGSNPSVSGNAYLDLYQAGVTYTVAPGLTAGLEYSYFRGKEKDVTAPISDRGSIIMIDTRLAF